MTPLPFRKRLADNVILLGGVVLLLIAMITASRSGSFERLRAKLQHTAETPLAGQQEVSKREGRAPFNLDSDYTTDNPSDYTPKMRAAAELAYQHMKRGEFREAEAAYREVLAAKPDSASMRSAAASARGLQGDLQGAEQEFRMALEMDPTDPGGLLGLGYIESQRGNYVSAYNFYGRLVNKIPYNEDGLFGLGVSASRTGRYEQAIGALTKFLELYPNSNRAAHSRTLLEQSIAAKRSRDAGK